MTPATQRGAVVLVGCGRLGSAMVEGWLRTGAVDPRELIIITPSEKPAAGAARAAGARINPASDVLAEVRALVLAVKPVSWRGALAPLADHLDPSAVVVSVMAGVRADDMTAAAGRPVARVMPTTAVAQGAGVAALWSDDDHAREVARGLFAAMADVVDLDDETQMDAATAVAGSAPAFVYAFVEALARAGAVQGLADQAAARLARGALRSAGAGAGTELEMSELIARIASPGGTTRAGLDAMTENGGLDRVAEAAVKAAVERARALSA
jgi:pyrroline-5-carboxylate reductase